MSNPEQDPGVLVCTEGAPVPDLEVIEARDVPLGGPRAMLVRRTLPSRQRSLIGAWCFLDHYGPDRVVDSGGMSVAPHPHTGLSTVSWLFTGEIEHQDSAGNVAMVRPGELNLMTAGRGISHSEVSTPAAEVLHGAQLWVALPEATRNCEPGFDHYVPQPIALDGAVARVFLGSLVGDTSPVATHTPLLGAELILDAGAELTIDLDEIFEHGLLVDQGAVVLDGRELAPAELGYLAPGRSSIVLRATADSRILLLGGPPFGESIVMWWNFVGRSHDEIVGFRDDWQAQITRDGEVIGDSRDAAPGRFGVVADQPLPPIPAPPLPNARLRERR
ncbi:pirin family protein [Nocardioides sp. Bht2]|uniref:pirin family protein n=1 Tax=Nocardioides sp. Bht2 TaxID=3392297 RepID=UPI0039B3E68D